MAVVRRADPTTVQGRAPPTPAPPPAFRGQVRGRPAAGSTRFLRRRAGRPPCRGAGRARSGGPPRRHRRRSGGPRGPGGAPGPGPGRHGTAGGGDGAGAAGVEALLRRGVGGAGPGDAVAGRPAPDPGPVGPLRADDGGRPGRRLPAEAARGLSVASGGCPRSGGPRSPPPSPSGPGAAWSSTSCRPSTPMPLDLDRSGRCRPGRPGPLRRPGRPAGRRPRGQVGQRADWRGPSSTTDLEAADGVPLRRLAGPVCGDGDRRHRGREGPGRAPGRRITRGSLRNSYAPLTHGLGTAGPMVG